MESVIQSGGIYKILILLKKMQYNDWKLDNKQMKNTTVEEINTFLKIYVIIICLHLTLYYIHELFLWSSSFCLHVQQPFPIHIRYLFSAHIQAILAWPL